MLFLAQSAIFFSDYSVSAPWIESPRAIVAPGHAFARSRSDEPIPLPSLVQKGMIFLPAQSKRSNSVNIAMGMVPHQFG